MSAPGFFVTGTDTGVGKTVASCGLVRALRAEGIDAGAMKPIETGVGADGPQDAQALRRAAGDLDPLADVCPIQLPLPAAPSVAAADAGSAIELEPIEDAFARIAARRAAVVVEGAGGLLVPIRDGLQGQGFDMADLAARLGLPLIVVARAALGTINHTLLTLEAAASRGLEVAGVVICHCTGPLSEADALNLAPLRGQLGDRLIAEIPPLAEGAEADRNGFRLDRLLARLR